jgi:uncharacterized protein
MKTPKNKFQIKTQLESKRIFQIAFLMLFLFTNNAIFSQFKIPEIPSFQTSVYDYANLLSANEKAQLEEKLIKYSDSTTTQIVVVTVPTINGEDIGILTPKWAHQWGIGQKKEDNGVFILLAQQERKIWISPGYGVEDRLTAGITGEIIRNIIIPEFKAGSYYNGLNKGADVIFDVLKGKYKGERIQDSGDENIIPVLIFIIFFIILMIIISKNKNNGNNSGSGRTPSLLDMIILSNMGRSSGGGFGGSSGGGFGGGSSGGFGGGFGGGGFSGGGAGGSW